MSSNAYSLTSSLYSFDRFTIVLYDKGNNAASNEFYFSSTDNNYYIICIIQYDHSYCIEIKSNISITFKVITFPSKILQIIQTTGAPTIQPE